MTITPTPPATATEPVPTPVLEPDTVSSVLDRAGRYALRPGYEGGNISTTIGFKHVHYVMEAAVLEHFRSAGLGATTLLLEMGVCFDVVSVATRLHSVLLLDDRVVADVVPRPRDGALRFELTLTVDRDRRPTRATTSTLEVVLRRDPAVPTPPREVPEELRPYVVERLATAEPRPLAATPSEGAELGDQRGTTSASDDPVLAELVGTANAFGWKWRVPYFYCHFTERMQMSGFLRQMEEIVHLFVADRGIGIAKLLFGRGWIPVVANCRLRLLDEVRMEEELYSVYTVTDVFKDILYTARMDCYVVRDGNLVPVATGEITHGYVRKESQDKEWELQMFDEPVRRALGGERVELP